VLIRDEGTLLKTTSQWCRHIAHMPRPKIIVAWRWEVVGRYGKGKSRKVAVGGEGGGSGGGGSKDIRKGHRG